MPQTETKPVHISDALAALPTTPAAIAEYFCEQEIRGRRLSAHGCPVYEYLIRAGVPKCELRYGVTSFSIQNLDLQALDHPLPPAVRDFIKCFDKGEYPELAAK